MSRGRPPRYQPAPATPTPSVAPAELEAMLAQMESDVVPPPVTPVEEPDGLPMDKAPRDGRRVWLSDGTSARPVLAHWRTTRAFQGTQWREVTGWYRWPGTVPLGFEPVCWYDASEGI